MVYALLKTLHVLGVVLWVGGMLFAHLFLRPSLALLDPPLRLKLMREVLRRFLAAVLVAALLVLASGLGMIHQASTSTVAAAAGSGRFVWPVDWIAMIALGLLMIAIFGHIRFVLYKRFGAALDAGNVPVAAAGLARIRAWVATNLAIGVGVIALVLLV
jgi:uncharacterized membrane protein